MTSSDKELEQQLLEAGNKLVEPPSSVDELLPLLDQVESCLSRVEQSPSKSMQSALSPSLEALVTDKLFRHSDIDVKVAVASCISEITRITAPDAPYDDDQMRNVFQLIVSSFENLADLSSRSYGKRTSILETVAKVRSCVVMLDLECDALIIEMFQHFLNSIRDHHPENVFSSMETIMTLVLEESEEISPELLSPLLDCVKQGKEEVPSVVRKVGEKVLESCTDKVKPVAQKLAEKVLECCATKVKPYLIHAVKTLDISLDDYSDIVTSICQDSAVAAEQNDVHIADANKVEENKPPEASLAEVAQADKQIPAEVTSPKQADPGGDKSPKSVVSNGVTQTAEDDSLADSDSLKKQEDGNLLEQSKSVDMSSSAEPDSLDAEKVVITESKQEESTKKRRKKVTLIKLTEPSKSSADTEKDAKGHPDDKVQSKDLSKSPSRDVPAEIAVTSEDQKETGSPPSSPKALEDESATVASPLASGSLPEENIKNSRRSRKKESLTKGSSPSADDVPKKAPEGTSDSEAKPHKRSGRKAPAEVSKEERAPTATALKKGSIISDLEGKSSKQTSKKAASSNNMDDSSLKKPEDKRRRSRGKAISEQNVSKSSAKDDDKEKISPKSATKLSKDEHEQETPRTDTKRKRSAAKEQASDGREHGAELVGTKVKVWWPQDRKFYEGVVESFDPVKKKHRVAYTDGDEEILNLKRQRWEIIEGDSGSEKGEATDHPSPDSSSDMPLKKKVKTMDVSSPKKDGGASSGKSKGAVTKSGRKSKEVSKPDGKSVDDSKTGKKVEDDTGGKTKDYGTKHGSKSADVATKTASKSKNDDIVSSKTSKSKEDGSSTPKTFKSKQETPRAGKSKQDSVKVTFSVKSKTSKSSGKSNTNGGGKLKSDSLKVKENEDENEDEENSGDSGNAQESAKGKLASSSKGNEVKSGKKRRRV